MAEAKKSTDDATSAPPIDDVAKPGKTPANPSAKPIIVSHKPVLKQDPMLGEKTEDEKPQKSPLRPKREIKLQPTNDLKLEDDSNKSDKEKTKDTPASPEEISESSDAAAIDALADQTSSKKTEQKAKEEADKKAEELNKLAQSGKYHLPIHDGVYARRGIGHIIINFLLVILLLAAATILAVDAKYIYLPLGLPFDLIK